MKAALLKELNHFEIEEIEIPKIKPNEVLVRVKAAGICGSDIHKMQTKWTRELPMVLGHEISGIVADVGDQVNTIKPNNRVAIAHLIPCNNCFYCEQGKFQFCEDYDLFGSHKYGGFEEYIKVPKENVIKIGEEVSYEEGAMLEPLSVASYGVLGLKPQLGDVVAVFGLGTIGILTIQLLNLAGVKKIIGIDIDNKKLNESKKYGVTDIINPLYKDIEQEIFSLTNDLGVDISIECAGSVITQEQCLLVTKKGGLIGYQGIAYSPVNLSQRAFENIFRREYTIKGFWNSYATPFPGKAWNYSLYLIQSKKIKLQDLISHRFVLDDIQKAFDLTVNKHESYNKVMVFPK
ncbi:galactitol-1-phosphate 5-dehydrogenase [Staphylococcus pseudoxylosus]|uniref:Galactitol-1-phosphate 5-dehydrogenase n=1 Tax=Staphylococcus pseudoxylosus TaxID=2282419 RepID=A0AAQ0MEU0_9STAP|nr:galactitol-1-phosphate 5-dehydrogenase [Staphylococcus pseudoxylosus]MCE5003669.1 galactitol-1-phosphate 5-dehydrogenase [Staphylococcus pseudoxylosus]RMI83900.1 galactitol-1-phosphate 5-dehydrogenase [Staphylococcus pseudoxylosus]